MIKLIAKVSNLNLSELIREGAKKEIKAQTKRINRDDWREFVGALKTGPKDMSLTINDIYK